jgi:uncharacterized membrane-anchored protein YhcB (DUF1043 family)
MEYTSMFEPLLLICLTLCLGILIGCISMLWVSAKELKKTNEELEKFRELYFEEVRINSIIDEKKHTTLTGALARDRVCDDITRIEEGLDHKGE